MFKVIFLFSKVVTLYEEKKYVNSLVNINKNKF